MYVFQTKNVEEGIKTFAVPLHFVRGSGGNLTMNNGSFFRTTPGTFNSGSFAGYNDCFPLAVPVNSQLKSIVLTCTNASYDFNANSGPINFLLEFRDIFHNGSSVYSTYLVQFGNFSGSQIGYGFNTFVLDDSNFTLQTGSPTIQAGDLIGFRFVKSSTGVRDINNFQNILLTLNFEEVV